MHPTRQSSATHEMRLREEPFCAIASGKKTVEMRLFDEKRQRIRPGDEILFRLDGGEASVRAVVVCLHPFPSFDALYAALIPTLGAEALGYAEGETPNPADMLAYYSEDLIAQYGVIGIEIARK